jgi:hypothetical protein
LKSSDQSLSITFEPNSHLKRIESQVFLGCSVRVLIPPSVSFIVYDAHQSLDYLSLSDAHSKSLFDCFHGSVKASNIFFDAKHQIQIADFSAICLENGSVEPFSGSEWNPAVDIPRFCALLSEIAVTRTSIVSMDATRPVLCSSVRSDDN